MHPKRARNPARGFTLIELLITILIIAMLMGLLLVGFSHAIRVARRTAAGQDVASLRMGVEQFRNDFNTLPPLVKDGFAPTPDGRKPPLVSAGKRLIPFVYSMGDAEDLKFLRGERDEPRYRFSVYSLAYYVMGALGSDVDGVEGPGAKAPKGDGTFDVLTNRTYKPLFDPKNGGLETVDAKEGRIELRDGNGQAYRYYRWAPGRTTGSGSQKGILNVPTLVAASKDAGEFGDAKYAIVAAGADGLFGDIGIESYPDQPAEQIENKALIGAKLGKQFDTDADAEAAARSDNVVEVGR